jgi:hypothetical protein
MDNEALMSGLRKLTGYAHGWMHPGYIHFTKAEAEAVLQALDKLASKASPDDSPVGVSE